jgi:hypothetical protein
MTPEVTQPAVKVASVYGSHLAEKDNDDVRGIEFRTTVNFVPRGLSGFFCNLTTITIVNCGLKSISREDLSEYKYLERLSLNVNKLTSVPDDLFVDKPNLHSISFNSNKIEYLSTNLFKPIMNNDFVCVDFQKNKKIDAILYPGYPKTVQSIADLMKIIDAQCSRPEHSKSSNLTQEQILANSTSNQRENLACGFEDLLTSGKFSDFVIVLSKSKQFYVHKNILAVQSKVFAEMFEKDPKAIEMKIEDLSAEAVKEFLLFLYTGKLQNLAENSLEIFALASKLKVSILQEAMVKLISNQLNESNAFKTFQVAHTFQSDELKRASFRAIQKMFPDKKLPDMFMEDMQRVKEIVAAKEKLDSVHVTNKFHDFFKRKKDK